MEFKALYYNCTCSFCDILLLHPVLFHDLPVQRICRILEKINACITADYHRIGSGISFESRYVLSGKAFVPFFEASYEE